MSYEKAAILSTLSKIRNAELVLPAIQRDFVWEPERMYRLLDSIFRGYPFSTLLFWNTKQRIQYRQFTKDWTNDVRFTFQIKPDGQRGTMVLDGQQRLQTMYLAIYGSYDQKVLYFDLLSGIDPDDISQAKYHFEFLSTTEAELRNDRGSGVQYWVPLRDLVGFNFGQITAKSFQYLNQLHISPESDSGRRLTGNIGAAYGALKGDERLNYFTIDKQYDEDGQVTSLDEILEIFVRVNSGGQTLSKSDLMFSLMQMLWEGAADAIAELVDTLNRKGRYDFDKDFILKVALVCTSQGARYSVDKLRNETGVNEIKRCFPNIAEALINCMENLIIAKGRFIDDRILRSYNTLIPFIFFFYLEPNQQVRSEETLLRMNHALYISLMTSLFSRFADNYIDQVVTSIILPHHQKYPGQFPLDDYLAFVHSKQGRNKLDDWLLQNNTQYLMNILEGGTRLPEGRRSRRPEVDHIFPRSKLQSMGVPEPSANHYANLRLISQPENNWKHAQNPQPYFDADPKAAARYYVPTDLLSYEQYALFLEKRSALIWGQINHFFGQNDDREGGLPIIQSTEARKTTSTLQPTALRLALETMLTEEQKTLPVLQDNTQWIEAFRKASFSPQWCGRYHWALYAAGINSIGDLAAAVIALGLRITHYSNGLPFYQFAKLPPDYTDFQIPTREFGGHAWKSALVTLAQCDLGWKEYLVK